LLGYIFVTKAYVKNRKKILLNSNISSTFLQYGELWPIMAEICWRVWGTPANLDGFHVLAVLLHGTLVVGVSQTLRCSTVPPIFCRAAITLGIGPHSSIVLQRCNPWSCRRLPYLHKPATVIVTSFSL